MAVINAVRNLGDRGIAMISQKPGVLSRAAGRQNLDVTVVENITEGIPCGP